MEKGAPLSLNSDIICIAHADPAFQCTGTTNFETSNLLRHQVVPINEGHCAENDFVLHQ